MYRVTSLLGGVVTEDVEEFDSIDTVLQVMETCSSADYMADLRKWLASGAHEALTIKESSAYTDLWEHIP